MDHPPCLPPETAADGPDGGDAGHSHQPQSHGGRDHVGVTGQQRPQLVPDTGFGRLGVSDGDEDGVEPDKAQRPWSQPSMPADQAVLTEDLLHGGYAAHQEHHEECEVRTHQAGVLYGTAVAGMLFVWLVILNTHLRFRQAITRERLLSLPMRLWAHPLFTIVG